MNELRGLATPIHQTSGLDKKHGIPAVKKRAEFIPPFLTRMFHQSLTATTDMNVLPCVLGCRSLRRTF